MRQRILLLIANHIIISRNGLVGEVDASVALCQLHGPFSLQFFLLGWRLTVGFAILRGCIEIFTDGIEFISFLHSLIRSTAHQQQVTQYQIEIEKVFPHTYIIDYCLDSGKGSR